jgi:cell division protein FtsQ
MKNKWILWLLWVVALAAMILALVMVDKHHGETVCTEVVIRINRQDADDFITAKEIREYMIACGDSVKGQKLADINLHRLEALIARNPYIAEAKVYAGMEGKVHIDVVQRRPIVRLENPGGDPFYISDDGRVIPHNPARPARVLLANGCFNYDIHSKYVQKLDLCVDENSPGRDSLLTTLAIYRIYKIAGFISNSTFLKAQMAQLYLDSRGDFMLVPVVGHHLIVLGDDTDLAEKFWKLEMFYRKGLSQVGWDIYDTINLKFENQVVCTKRKN